MQQTKKLTTISYVVSTVMAVPFIISSIMKLINPPTVAEGFNHLGLPVDLRVPIGILELLCAVIFLTPRTCVLGAILLTGYLGGAILTHLRMSEPVYLQILFGIMIWGSLFLRYETLRNLIPFAKR